MYKAILIDDEKWILESLKGTVDWEALGFEIAGTAANGFEGLECIRSLRPDVALVDIRMPGMNGLEMIGKAKESGAATKFVIASGYADFEYAKRAIAFGAVGYCLKPFEKDDLAETLASVIPILDAERQAALNEAMALLLDSDVVPSAPLQETLLRAGFEWDEDRGACVLVARGAGSDGWSERYGAAPLRIGSGKTAFVLQGDRRDEVVRDLQASLPESMRSAGLSERFHDLGRIREHIEAAGIASFVEFTGGGRTLGIADRSRETPLNPEIMDSLFQAIQRKDLPSVRSCLASLEARFRAGEYDIRHARRLYRTVTAAVYRLSPNQGDMDPTEDDRLAESYASVFDMIRGLAEWIAEGFAPPVPAEGDGNGKTIASLIAEYIRERIHQNVSIQEIASHFYLHPNYVSALLKKELQMSFTKYVTDLRMKRACELLRSTSLSVGEIAERSGYNDYFYFAKLFKKHTGKTPTDFRKAHT